MASVCSGSGLRGERVRAWDPLPAGDAGRCDQANPRGPSCTPSVNRLEALAEIAVGFVLNERYKVCSMPKK